MIPIISLIDYSISVMLGDRLYTDAPYLVYVGCVTASVTHQNIRMVR
ncbi:hypothetical protein [Nostoc sp. CCY 9925]